MNCYTPKKHKFEMKGFLIFCISLLFFSACKPDGNTYQAPDFPQEKHLHGQILIPADSLLIQYPYGLYADDDNIYLLALAEGHWMQVYDRHSGRFVARGIPFGQCRCRFFRGAPETVQKQHVPYCTSQGGQEREHVFLRGCI